MRKTAPYKGLFMIAVVILLLSGNDPLMACSEPGSPATDDTKKVDAKRDSLSYTVCEKHAKETAKVKLLPPEPVKVVPSPDSPNSPGTEPKQPARNEIANGNMSFNFLYYLFYKFSVSEFFKTPDFSESTTY